MSCDAIVAIADKERQTAALGSIAVTEYGALT